MACDNSKIEAAECLMKHGAQINNRDTTLVSDELYKCYHWCIAKNYIAKNTALGWWEGDKDVEIGEVSLLREW